MWLFPESFSESTIADFGNGTGLGMTASGGLAFSSQTFSGITLRQNAYNHVALTRSGRVLTCYVVSLSGNSSSLSLQKATLTLKAKTDADGNYIIQGIPFSGEGSTYSIIPVYGIHEFKPAKALRFVGRNSMVHTADFEDVSSFPSTFGVRAFIRANSMGASVSQILPEIRYLWIQAAAYLGMACLVYRYQFRLMRKATGRRASLGN